MRRYILVVLLAVAGLATSGTGPAAAADTQVRVFPAVKYVAQSSPAFSVDVRAENVSTPEVHVIYPETNVDTELSLGATPELRATYAQSNVNTDLAIGDVAAREARGQGFRVTQSGPVNRVLLWVKKVGNPEDGLKVEIRADSGGLPDGSPGGLLSASAVVSGVDDLTTSYALVLFTLLSPPTLSTGTQYHLVVKRTSPLGPDAANYYRWGADNSPTYADGAASVYNGSVWAAASPAADHAFTVQAAPAGRSQGFKVPSTTPVNRVLLWLKRVGSLTGTDGFLSLEIRDDSGGVPGTVLATSTSVDVSLVGTSYAWMLFNVNSPPQLSPGTQYHLVLKWIDMPEGGPRVVWGADTSSPGYANGAASVYYGGSTWVAPAPAADHAFEVAYACPSGGGTGPCGLGGFELEMHFLTSQFQFNSITVGPFLTSTGRALFPCTNPPSHNPAGGVIAFRCTTTGGTPLGPQGSGMLASASFTALGSGGQLDLANTVLTDINSTSISHTEQDGQVTVFVASGDSDGDGCTDLKEEGDSLLTGGQRNPYDPYDFYDVPVPANADPTANGPRNKVVDISDVLGVLFYAFAEDNGAPNSNGVDYDSIKHSCTINGVPNLEEGLCYDRSPASPVSGPPNGVVDISDVLSALEQAFAADCS
jgi:hypothetical protein